ncbi:alpha/beta hydrolase [Actinomycetaceae bacterium TAE3-ERU4]|nr:alpha/beta hydrolase [Actinomycetaceae bacterium TAE3-ERU4]
MINSESMSDVKPWENWSAPLGQWGPDILGPGFQAQTLALDPDDEGDVVATLVRHLASDDPGAVEDTPQVPHFNILYLHGWNDYFFQRELARHSARAGARFYGLDLRKYGRSLRSHQTFGYVDSLTVYDEDIAAALKVIRAEDSVRGCATPLPVVLMGHSTGGLTATMWAARHRGELAGLVLNSPWLENHISPFMRTVTRPFFKKIAQLQPRRVLPFGGGPNFYAMSFSGWRESDGPLPENLQAWPNDPAVTGKWGTNPKWKSPQGQKTLAGWFAAILRAHEQVANGLAIDCPVFMGAAVTSEFGKTWSPRMRRGDSVLHVQNLARRAAWLSRSLTLMRYESMHDITLSDPEVRMEYYGDLYRWYADNIPVSPGTDPVVLPDTILPAV